MPVGNELTEDEYVPANGPLGGEDPLETEAGSVEAIPELMLGLGLDLPELNPDPELLPELNPEPPELLPGLKPDPEDRPGLDQDLNACLCCPRCPQATFPVMEAVLECRDKLGFPRTSDPVTCTENDMTMSKSM